MTQIALLALVEGLFKYIGLPQWRTSLEILRGLPPGDGKHDTLAQRWFKAGPASKH